MRELEETNCEIKNFIGFELPQWNQTEELASQEEQVTTDGSKESNSSQVVGGFLGNECKHAWLCHGTQLVVIDIRYGRLISSWNFPNKITSISPFPTQHGHVPLLLVGLDNNALRIKDSIGLLCIFDCCTSTILTTIEVPAGVEKACVIHGGAEWEEFHEKRPDTVLSGNTGLIFAALRNLQHIIIDVNRPLWLKAFQEGKSITAKLEFVNNTESHTTLNKNKGLTHLAYELMDRDIEQYIGFDRADFEATPLYDESLCSVLLSSTKIGCLITGCLGRVIIWQHDGSIGWISPSFDENAYVTHIALLEPSDDPRPFYYLWIACQSDSSQSSAVLRMYAILFNTKQYDKNGESSLYYNLDSEPSLKFELELEQGERVHSLLSVERENLREYTDSSSRRGEDSLLLIGSDERVLLFDLNRWYKEQMPRTMAECRNPNSVMASYRTKSDDGSIRSILACSYIPRSLREFPSKGPGSPEELFYPNSLMFEWVELGVEGLTFWLARGVQAELLREIMIAGPIVLIKPTETYRRCLVAGLMPFDSIPQDYTFEADYFQQREMLLSICLEQRWTSFLIRCGTEWSDGSAAYLYPEFLRWGVERASEIKLITDNLCVPLFDQSGANIGESEVKTLRCCCQQIECLTNVVANLPNLKADLEKQRRALKRISTYLQVLLWFYNVGLLPETQEFEEEEEDVPQIALSMKIPYPKAKLVEFYKKIRNNDKSKDKKEDKAINEQKNENILFIDHLISENCLPLRAQWEREAGMECPNPGGLYPPPSLQSLLRSYLIDCHKEEQDYFEYEEDRDLVEMESKHSITIYLLMDLAMLLQGTYPSIDQLIKYPSAFKLSPSLIKIIQAFWLLDHEDYDGFFKIITGQLIMTCDIKDWQHKFAINTLLRNDQHKLALTYLRILRPPLSSLEEQSTIIALTVGQGMVETAFHLRPPSHYAQLLTRFFEACKSHGKLAQILHLSLDTEEEEAFLKFLKESNCEDTRLLYYLQRCRHIEATDICASEKMFNSRRSVAPSKIHPTAMKMLNAFNATLPEITKCFANSISKSANSIPSSKSYNHQQQLSFMDPNSVMASGPPRGYPRPMSQCRNNVKEIYEVVLNKTRETCFKADKPAGTPNHVPFLGAPCSTIVYCTRTTNGEQPDVNDVLYPERKTFKGKRTLNMMNDGEDNTDVEMGKKRRKLESHSDSLLNSDNESQPQRRLSMSQVCNTPLVQRKVRHMEGSDLSGLVTETPHSILKIRQMIKRNSNSPGYAYGNDGSNEALYKRSAAGDARPARQIRFSMDRFSSNEDSIYSPSSSNKEESEMENSRSASKMDERESCMEESYYSPNVSAKSLRDSSILSDSSVTKFLRGPRPRPSLRRTSLLSQTSSDYHSNKTNSSFNSTLDASKLETTFDKKGSNITPRKSALSPNIYSASVLSPNTSGECSPLKIPLIRINDKRQDEESEESDEQSENEEVITEFNNTEVDKNSSRESSIQEIGIEEQSEEDKNEEEMGKANDEVENQDNEEEAHERSISMHSNRDDEISEDEEKMVETTEQPILSKHGEELEEGEIEDDDEDTFQSLPNSLDNTAASEMMISGHYQLNDNNEARYSTTLGARMPRASTFISEQYGQDYSFTENLITNKNTSSNEYSLTKPIFLDNRGMIKFGNSVDITDDESEIEADSPALQPVAQEEDDEDEGELTLNLSGSEGSDEEKLEKGNEISRQIEEDIKKVNQTLAEETASFISRLSQTSARSRASIKDRKTPEPTETSMSSRLRQTSRSPTNKIDLEGVGTPSRRSSRQLASIQHRVPTPRRSIKSMSQSPTAKSNDTVNITESDHKVNRGKRSTSVTKEVKKILSNAISESTIPKIVIDRVVEQTLKEPKSSIKSKSQSPSKSQEEVNRESLIDLEQPVKVVEKSTRTRATRAGSVTKEVSKTEVEKPARKTRAASIAKDTTVVNAESKETIEKSEADNDSQKTSKLRATRASSLAKDTTIKAVRTKAAPETVEDVDDEKGQSAIKKMKAAPIAEENDAHEEKSIARKTRAASVTKEEDKHEEKAQSTVRKTRAAFILEEDEVFDVKEQTSTRKTRAASVIKEDKSQEDKTHATRKTRAASVAKDESQEEKIHTTRKTRAASVAKDEPQEEKAHTIRKTRAASIAKENEPQEEKTHTPRRTRAASVAKEDESQEEKTHTPRRTRATSVAKEDESQEEKTRVTRKTRAASIAKEDESQEEKTLTPRKTRAASIAKEDESQEQKTRPARKTRAASVSNDEETKPLAKRTTRASSVAKDSNIVEVDEAATKKSTRRRAGSLPKDVSIGLESSRLLSRNRRSTSLLKEVILEESISQLESPVSAKRLKASHVAEESIASSPAANTRSRRSSVQSVPEELEEILSVKATTRKSNEKKQVSKEDINRSRRAASVDSTVPAVTGKRLTRSVLAKTSSILDDVIPEEGSTTTKLAGKPPTRRKRTTSASTDPVEEKEKEKEKVGRPKRGRKASESKDFLFSAPEEAGEEPSDGEDECRMPTYKFSEPTELEKCDSAVCNDEEYFDMTTMILKRNDKDTKQTTLVRTLQRPRTCFVLPKKTKRIKFKKNDI